MTAGLALALASALGTNVAFLFKQRGAVLAPPVRGRHPLRSAVDLFRSRWFALGWVVAVVAWGLHVGALAVAPLSVVQAVLSGGLVFLGVLGERYFGFHLSRRQWAGVIVTAFGLAVIAITGGRHTSAVRHYSLAALIAVECGVFALGAALIGISMHGSVGPAAEGLLLGVAAGVLFGVSDIALKYLTEALHGGLDEIISEWTLAAIAASVLAFYASARGLQLGPGVAVIAFTSVAANLAAIVGGILVFRDPIGIGAPAIVGRVTAFGLVVAGAALMPLPQRAARLETANSRLEPMPTRHLDDLRAQAQHARQSYDLYKAKAYGPRPTSAARMRELQRASELAEALLSAAEAKERRARTTGGSPPDPS